VEIREFEGAYGRQAAASSLDVLDDLVSSQNVSTRVARWYVAPRPRKQAMATELLINPYLARVHDGRF
jgi:hypothetical protein